MALDFRSGYDRFVAGDEEAHARATLAEMQGRISRGPSSALGVASEASPEQVRAAFLTLTKQFHPARFGRMSSDVQRLSNEVFLGIKSAHEAMMRALGAPMRSGLGSGPRTGTIPVLTAEGSSRTPAGPNPVLRGRGTTSQPPLGRPQSPTPSRTMTPARAGSPTNPVTSRTATGTPSAPHSTPPLGVRIATPPATRPGTPPTARPGTPPIRPASPPLLPPKPAIHDADTIRGTGAQQRTAPVFDERIELQQALDLMAAKNWLAARQAMHALAARVPQSKQYRALLCYTRGREAQATGRGEEAALEFQRALQLDPELSQAKSALAELLRRR